MIIMWAESATGRKVSDDSAVECVQKSIILGVSKGESQGDGSCDILASPLTS